MTTPVVHSIELIAKCGTDSCCLENSGWVADCLIRSSYSHWVVMGLSVFGIIWGSIQFMAVKKVEIDDSKIKVDEEAAREARKACDDETDVEVKAAMELMMLPQNGKEVKAQMLKVQGYIKEGAKTFLAKEYTYLAIFCALFAVILVVAVDQPWNENEAKDNIAFPMTTMAFLVGAATSMLCGYIGMMVATDANARTTG